MVIERLHGVYGCLTAGHASIVHFLLRAGADKESRDKVILRSSEVILYMHQEIGFLLKYRSTYLLRILRIPF